MKFLITISFIIASFSCAFAQENNTRENAVVLNDSVPVAVPTDSLKALIPDSTSVSFGIASFYHQKFNGRKTSSGETFSNNNLTAAHKTLKLGTYVKVRCLKNDSMVIVKVNDRLPPNSKRTIDLSIRAAKQLNFIRSGLTKVEITVLSKKPNSSSGSATKTKKQNEKHSHKKRNHRKR